MPVIHAFDHLLDMGAGIKRRLVVSAINLNDGGPLAILRDCLAHAVTSLDDSWEVIALVHDRRLLTDLPRVRLMEFPRSKRSWLYRLYYEWWRFRALSLELRPDVWLSLHDMTPCVTAARQAVYCHNASPFYRISLREACLQPKFLLFNLFYKYLYRVNIHRNRFVIVQQKWLRDAFERQYGVKNVIVAYPAIASKKNQSTTLKQSDRSCYIFLYPALPRVHKNLEVVCEAAIRLNQRGVSGFQVRLTIDGQENRYATALVKRYLTTPGIAFIGRQSHEAMMDQYAQCDCLLFPSKLETWGLPITEAKAFDRPMIVADLPYAHETVGEYDKVAFFDPQNAEQLADLMYAQIMSRPVLGYSNCALPSPPFAQDWHALWELLVSDLP